MLHLGNRAFVLLSLSALLAGCGGDPQVGPQGTQGVRGPGGDPSISALTPGKVFLERTTDVTLSGYSTSWTDAAVVDFGPGINVTKKIVASPTAIVASIEVTDAALLGTRDVTVTEGSVAVVYKGAFEIKAPLEVSSVQGNAAQGSIFVMDVVQRDLNTPFDTTTVGDGFFTPLQYTNLKTKLPSGLSASVNSADIFSVDLVMLSDVKAPAGPVEMGIFSGPMGDVITSTARDAFTIEARAPVELKAGIKGKGFMKGPFDSLLFSYTPSASGKVLKIEATASLTSGSPYVAVLPASGSFADLLLLDTAPVLLATDSIYYLVCWDSSGASGYDASVIVKEENAEETEPNNTCKMGQKVTPLPADLKNISLADKDDVDWFEITATAADVGKVVHVVTAPGEKETDTLVEVFADDCTTSLGGASEDLAYHEDHSSTAIPAAGIYYVKVSASTYGFTGQLYDLSIALE